VDFDFLRITALSVLACAARRVKFYRKAIDALTEAKNICTSEGKQNSMHPLMTALTLLNLSSVLGDIDHDEHGLRWGLEALTMMYELFAKMVLPEAVQAYYLVLACHNAALLNVKLGKWADAVELVNEGIEFTKTLGDNDDGLRRKLIAIGAQAKRVPEGFLHEAVNALNGWGEERGVWNLSFWDFGIGEIQEEIHVLKHSQTLKHVIIENFDADHEGRKDTAVENAQLAKLVIALVQCQSLEQLTVSNLEFDPRKVWYRVRKRSFLESSWFASALNFAAIRDMQKPGVADFKGMLKNLNRFSRKLVLFLVVLGNECGGVDLSENNISRTASAVVCALRWPVRPKFTHEVNTLVLRGNDLDEYTAAELANIWDLTSEVATDIFEDPMLEPLTPSGGIMVSRNASIRDVALSIATPGVSSLDVSHNVKIGDTGFDKLTSGIMRYKPFKVLLADTIGLTSSGCHAVEKLVSTKLESLCLSNNNIGSEGAEVVCKAAVYFEHLHILQLDACSIDSSAARTLSELFRAHHTLRTVHLNHNRLGSDGAITFCEGAAESTSLTTVHIAYNDIYTADAAEAIGNMMTSCETLLEMNLSGNRIDSMGAPHIGSAIEHSRILTMYLEDMGFTDLTIDDFLDHGAAETQDLQVMILNKNPVGDEGLGIIAECLSIGLTDLSLSSCSLTAASQATLLNLVSLSPNLRSLDLSDNALGPHGCADMVMWMTQNEKDNFSLRSLELASCGLGDEGLVQLVPILASVTYLGVRSNGITCAGLEAVMHSNQMIQLRTLDLAGNQIGERGVHALTKRFQQEHKRSLWNPKQLTSTIDTVILTNNPPISESLALSTEAFLRVHNPLLLVVW